MENGESRMVIGGLPKAWILLRLSDVQPSPRGRPSAGPSGPGPARPRWGQARKPLQDRHLPAVEAYRSRCPQWHQTVRYSPFAIRFRPSTVGGEGL